MRFRQLQQRLVQFFLNSVKLASRRGVLSEIKAIKSGLLGFEVQVVQLM